MLVGLKGFFVSVIGLVAAMALGGVALAQQPAPTARALATPTASALAPCPTGYTLTVSPPTASAPNTVSVAVSPQPDNIPPVAGDMWLHFHYFVDTDPTPAGQEIGGGPKIIHRPDQYFGGSSITADLDEPFGRQYAGGLAAGQHTVWVVLGRFGDTDAPGANEACDLRGSVTFTVAAALPGTGSGGYLGQNSSPLPMVTWLALAGASLVVLCLGVGLRNRTRRG